MQEDQYRRNVGSNQPDPQLVNTVTAVIQALQSGQNTSGQQERPAQSGSVPKTIDLIGLMFFIIEKFWIVLLTAIIAAGLFGYKASKSVPTYSATSKLYIVNPNSASINITDLQLGTVLTLDYQEVFKTWEVHEMVREELNLPYSYEAMQSFISVYNPEDTRLLYITATFYDAQTAADIANAYAKAAKEFIINTMRGEEPSDFSIALVPSVARVQSKTSALVKGFLLGSVLAVGLLTLLFVLDDRPRTPEDIAMYGGIPTLAVLPSSKEMKRLRNKQNRSNKGGGGRKS